MYEAMSEVYKIMIPIIEKNHDYKKLANIYRLVRGKKKISCPFIYYIKFLGFRFFLFFFFFF